MEYLKLQTRFTVTNEGVAVALENVRRDLVYGKTIPQPRDGWLFEGLIAHAGHYFLRLYNGPDVAYWVFDPDFNMIAATMEQFVLAVNDETLWSIVTAEIRGFASDAGDEATISHAHSLMSALAAALVSSERLMPEVRSLHDTLASGSDDAASFDLMAQINTPSKPLSIYEHVILAESLQAGGLRASNDTFGEVVFDRFLPLDNFWYIGFSSTMSHRHIAFITGHNKHVTCLYDTEKRVFRTNVTLSACGFNNIHLYRAMLLAFWFHPVLNQRRSPEFTKVGLAFRENHVGHYIWNELSAVQVLEDLGREAHVFLYPACNEPVFKVEAVFPDLKGRVVRNAFTTQHLLASIVGGVEFFPFMSFHVNQVYAARFIAQAKACEPDFHADMVRRKAERFVLVIGLRVENRVWVRQKEGYAELASHLAAFGQPITIVFDGHNYLDAEARTFVTSHREAGKPTDGVPQTVRLELDIVEYVERHCRDNGLDTIEIVNLIPCSISKSILAALECDYMVTHWGAGLAKYTWLAGADGCIISCREVLAGKYDLLIYDSAEFKENARPFFYYPFDHVTDIGWQTHTISIRDADRNDFDMDPSTFACTVRELVRQRLRAKLGA